MQRRFVVLFGLYSLFTTDENVTDNLQYEVPLGTSDHACLVWELAVEVQETVSSVQQKLNYWKAD